MKKFTLCSIVVRFSEVLIDRVFDVEPSKEDLMNVDLFSDERDSFREAIVDGLLADKIVGYSYDDQLIRIYFLLEVEEGETPNFEDLDAMFDAKGTTVEELDFYDNEESYDDEEENF